MVGDIYQSFASVLNGQYLELKPAAGKQVVIHNIYHPNDITLKMVDGSGNELAFLDDTGKNMVTNMYIHISNTQYLRVYNISGITMYLAADGIYTKDV
jgi:hypothetical protein